MLDSCYILYQAKKQSLIKHKGAKCEICGKKLLDFPELAEFHHTDPDDKEFSPSDANTLTFQKAMREIDKCVLVCVSCHRTLHFDREKFNKHKTKIEKKCQLLIEGKINYEKKTNDEDVLKLYNNGYTIRAIARELGYSRGPVKRILKKHGLEIKEYKHPIKISKKQIEELIQQGMSKKEMAQELNCSYATIHNMFNRYNLR